MKPQVSGSSRIFYRHNSPADTEPDTKKHRRGRNTGKLSQLLEMPLDVVFEVPHPSSLSSLRGPSHKRETMQIS